MIGSLPRFRFFRVIATLCAAAFAAWASAGVTDTVVTKNSPHLNQGRVKGGVRVMAGGNLNLNSGLTIDGSLLLPGTPQIQVNGGAASPPLLNGSGSAEPSNYRVTINGGVSLASITRNTNAEVLPTAIAPLAGTGTRTVHLNQPGDSPGNFATIRSLTINAQGGSVTLPPGRYERVTLTSASTLYLQAGNTVSPAIYDIQQLDINCGCHVMVPGPVALRLKNSLNLNGYIGASAHPEWLTMSISAGSFTLNSQSAFHGKAIVPAGSLTVNGSSLLHGLAFTDRLTLNGGGMIECEASGGTPNLPPVAGAGETSTARATPVAIPLVASDPENAALSYQIVTPPANGSVSLAGAVATYTPAAAFVGNDTFSFKVSDGTLESSPATVVVHVFQPNRAPVADSPVFVINQGESNAPVILSASDPDDDAITYQIASQPSSGILSGSPPTLAYTHTGPRSTTVVEDTFTFTATDSNGAVSAAGTVKLQLQPVNRPPVATALAASGNEDGAIALILGGSDPDGDALTYEIISDPANPSAAPGPLHGTLTGTAPALSYQPAADFHGTDRFYFRVKDSALSSTVAEVIVTVLPVNDAPVAMASSLTGAEDGTISIAFAASDIDGDSLVYDVALPAGFPGTVSVSGAGALFTPAADFHGTATFTFTATDASGAAATAAVTLIVTPVNDVPVIVADPAPLVLVEDGSLTFHPAGTDSDGDLLTYEITLAPLHGTLEANPDGSFTYTAAENFSGTDSFTYLAQDATESSAPATISINVTPVNDPPVAVSTILATTEDGSLAIALSATDADSDALTYEITALSAHGTLVGTAPEMLYTPAANYYGTDSFSFTVTDPSGATSSGTVSLTISTVNDPPVATGSRPSTREGSPVEIPLQATDADGDTLTIEVTTAPTKGSVTISAGQATYVPDAGFSGIDRFSFSASDGTATSAPAEVVVRVTANPQVEILSPLTGARVPAGEPVVVNVEGSDADGDLSVIEVSVDGLRAGGGSGAGVEIPLGVLPAGNHVVVATAIDSAGGRTTSPAVTVTVEAENLAPVVAAGSDRVVGIGQLGANLLLNPGNEQALVAGAIPGWTAAGGVAWGRGTASSRVLRASFSSANVYPPAPEGSVFFHVTGSGSAELFQDVVLDEAQRALVSAGGARISFETRAYSYQPKDVVPADFGGGSNGEVPIGDLDRAGAAVDFFGAGGELLDTRPATGAHVGDRWVRFAASSAVPAGTSRIRVRLLAEKSAIPDHQPVTYRNLDPAEKNDVLFDAVSLRLAAGAGEFLSGAVADDGLPDGGSLVVAWSQVAGPAAVIGQPDQAVTPVTLVEPGDYDFRLAASDGLLSAADLVRIHVEDAAGNVPPAVAAGPDLLAEFSTAAIALAGIVTDSSAGVSVTWSQVSGPADAVIADPLSAATTARLPLPGRYVFKLAAFDGEWTAEDEVVWEVAPPAVRRPLDLVVVTDHSGSMWANKPDGDPTAPIFKARLAAEQLVSSLDPAKDRVAVHKLRSQIRPLSSDLALARASLVQPRGEAGIESPYQASNVSVGIELATNHLLANPRSGPADRVIVIFGDGAGPYDDDSARAARNAGVRVIIVAFSNGVDPICTANMKILANTPSDFIEAATAGDALRVLELLNGTLSLPLNSSPVADAGPGIALANVTDSAFLRGSFQDDGLPENTTHAVLWEQVSGPAPVAFGSAESLDSQVSFTAAGEYRLRLTVNDGELSASDTIRIRVAHPAGLAAPSGMTAWWPFDGNLRDVAGTRDLTRLAYWEPPVFTPGAVNEAVRLTTGSDVLAGGAVGEIGLNGAAGFSLEFRFKARTTAVGYLFALVDPATGQVTHGITWGGMNSGSFARQKLHFLSPPSGPTSIGPTFFLTDTVVALNAWHHAVLTHSRTTNETWFYLDGVGRKVATSAITPHFPTGHRLFIGGVDANHFMNTAVTTDPYQRFDSDLDDFSFYNRPLTVREAELLYQSAPQGKEPPTLDRPPVVSAGEDLRVDAAGAVIPLDGLVSDDAADPQITWSKLSGPGTATFADTSSPVTTVTFSQAGIYTLRLTASDGFTTVSDVVQIHSGLSAAAPAEGLVAWMPGNLHAVDLISGRTGIWSGTESYAPVKAGDGFQFGGGISRIRYLAPEIAPANTSRGFSIETWLSLPTTLPAGSAELLAFQDLAGLKQHRLYLSQVTTGGVTTPQLNWSTSNATGGTPQVQVIKPFPLGTPFHLALTFDPATLRKKAFINAVQVADVAAGLVPVHHFEKELHVGGFPGEASNFPGQVDELSLYNIALTPARILAIVQAGAAGKFPVSPVDDPRVNAGPDLTLAPGEPHAFTPVIQAASFAAGPVVTAWAKVSGPGVASFDHPATPTATVTFPDAGRYVVSFTVSDGVTTAFDLVTVDVVAVPNEAPQVVVPATAALQLPIATLDLDPQVTDDGRPGGLLEHRWIPLDGPAPVALTATGGFRTRAVFPEAGDYTLLFEVSDGLEITRRQIAVTVVPAAEPNHAPLVTAGNDFTAANAAFSLTGIVTDDGKPAGQTVIQNWSLASGPGAVVFADPSAAATTATVARGGTYRLRLVAFDGQFYTTDEVVVAVPENAAGLPNRAPRVALPSFMTGRLPNLVFNLQPAVEDDGRTPGPLTFTWSQLDGPAVAEIVAPAEANTAIRVAVAGEYLFQLTVYDGEFSTIARIGIQANPANNDAPVLTMPPAATARAPETVTLSVIATDDGQPTGNLTYRWTQLSGPVAVALADPLALETQVTFDTGGSYLFELLVSDGSLSTRGTVAWNVLGVPEVRVVSPAAGSQITDRTLLTLQARASISGGVINAVRFEENGSLLGTASRSGGTHDWLLKLPPLGPGTHVITAVATSADGQTATSAPVSFEVVDFEEQALTLDIASPLEGDAVTAPMTVTGTVYSSRLASWNLTLSPLAGPGEAAPSAKVIASGTRAVMDGILGTLDPTLLENGIYQLSLYATTTAGTALRHTIPVLIEGNLKVGQFSLAFQDLSVDLPGTPLAISRTYDSRDAKGGDFGPGWSLSLSEYKIRKTRPMATDWEQTQTFEVFNGVGLPVFTVSPQNRKRVVLTMPGGRTETFESGVEVPLNHRSIGGQLGIGTKVFPANSQLFVPQQNLKMVFTPLDGTEGTLEAVDADDDHFWLGNATGEGEIISLLTFGAYDPKLFRYTTEGGTSYLIHERDGLQSITDIHGNTLTITHDGLIHSAGESVLFTRDTAGRISQITDPQGNALTYGYDAQGRLSTFTNRVGQTSRYEYTLPAFPHYLTRVIDPAGNTATRSEYNAEGRLIRQIDARGNAIEFTHLVSENRQIVHDRLGRPTILEYDDRGNVTRTTNALSDAVTMAYDADDREILTTTPLGFETAKTYDASDNVTSITDALGHVTRAVFSQPGRPSRMTNALGVSVDMSYTAAGLLRDIVAPDGSTSTATYAANGTLTTLTDPQGNLAETIHDAKGRLTEVRLTSATGERIAAKEFEHDPAGNVTAIIERNGPTAPPRITRIEYDAEHRETRRLYPDGTTSFTHYNTRGEIERTTDALNRDTFYTYDASSNLTSTVYPDGTGTRTIYDAESNVIASVDASGVAAYTIHDLLNRPSVAILPDATMPPEILTTPEAILEAWQNGLLADNPATLSEYDADGRLIRSTAPNGAVTTMTYDALGRLVATTDALGNVSTQTYDAGGRRISATDAKGQTTSFEYDVFNQLTQVTDALGHVTRTAYDSLGRRTSTTDAEGNITRFSYRANGQLEAVTDALGGVTRYGYDFLGQQVRQTDALNRTTSYEYDLMGRRVARVLPQGQREEMSYNSLGQMTARRDFNGHVITYGYEPLTDRLRSIVAPANHPSLSLAHAPARYDVTYDTLGRRRTATVENAAGTVLSAEQFTYDERSRLTGYAGGTGTLGYGYDPAGNLTGAKSGTHGGYDLSYDYDALNRLETVYRGQEGHDPAATAIAAYNYDATGNLNGSGYANGIQHAYAYDPLNRLLSLGVSKSTNTSPVTTLQAYAYTLNHLGHRTQIDESSGRTTTHTFDALHRLTSEAITTSSPITDHRSLGTIAYTHDPVGNRLTRTTTGTPDLTTLLPNQTQSFTPNDRLTTDTYDANGNTVSSPITDHGSPVTTSDTYSFDNRLIRRVRADGRVIDLTYNPDGHRLTRQVSQSGTIRSLSHYLTDPNNPTGYAQVVEEKDALAQQSVPAVPAGSPDPTLRKVHLYGHDLIATDFLANNQSSIINRKWYCYDGLGSVRGITDAAGNLEETYDYDAYGTLIGLAKRDTVTGTLVPIDLTDSSNPQSVIRIPQSAFLFTGEQWDPDLGMYFLRARYLNPATGRFHTQDSYEGSNSDPLTLHKYLYGNANPVMMTDPNGNFSLLAYVSGMVGQTVASAALGAEMGYAASYSDTLFAEVDAGVPLEEAHRRAKMAGALGSQLGGVLGAQMGAMNALIPGSGFAYAASLAIMSASGSAVQIADILRNGSQARINNAAVFFATSFALGLLDFSPTVVRTPRATSQNISSFYEAVAIKATKRLGDSNKVVLGKWSETGVSYNRVGKDLKATIFELDDWSDVISYAGSENMMNVNRAFLKQQWDAGKDFYFSHDPWEASVSGRPGNYFEQEVLYLMELGARDFVETGDGLWKAVR